jgi:hypothetical protein
MRHWPARKVLLWHWAVRCARGVIASAGLAVTQFGRPPVLGSDEQRFGVKDQILGRDQSD